MSPRKKILFLTGTRADFGKLKPLIAGVEADAAFESRIFVTGMHLLDRYGATLDEIQKAGFKNLFTFPNQDESTGAEMDEVLANTIRGLGRHVRELKPDLIVVHGDRVEALAGATVGALNNVLVAHVEGGELSGTVDELIRHAVSKLSHAHFVAHAEAATRLRQMGELRQSIFVIGSPDIDVMLSQQLPAFEDVLRHYELPFRDYAIFIYHPITTELGALRANIEGAVAALRASERNFLVIYPNNDAGSDVILDAIRGLEREPRFRVMPSLRFERFLTLLKHAQAIVGNSSAGVREAPVYGVPTVNIGTRQLNRFNYPSIVNVAEGYKAVLAALRQLPPHAPPSLHFGRGNSAELFLEQLRGDALWRIPRQKQFQDVAIEAAPPRA